MVKDGKGVKQKCIFTETLTDNLPTYQKKNIQLTRESLQNDHRQLANTYFLRMIAMAVKKDQQSYRNATSSNSTIKYTAGITFCTVAWFPYEFTGECVQFL